MQPWANTIRFYSHRLIAIVLVLKILPVIVIGARGSFP